MFRAMTGLFRASLGHVMEKSTSWSTDQCTHSQSLGLVAKQWRQILVIQFTWIGLSFVILRKALLAYGEPRACRSGVSLMAYGDMHCFFVFRLHIKCRSAKSHWLYLNSTHGSSQAAFDLFCIVLCLFRHSMSRLVVYELHAKQAKHSPSVFI